MGADDDLARARGWVAHLLAGGTTPWTAWTGRADPASTGPASTGPASTDVPGWDGPLPGAQHLEVLRRLNGLGAPDPALARTVLATAPPGRGALDLRLAGLPNRGYGARAVDPEALPADELLRVAVGALADRLATADLPERPVPTLRRRLEDEARARLPRRHPFRLVGPRARVDPVRRRLQELGRTPGGRGAVHYVVGADTGRLVVDAWAARAAEGTAPTWPEWLTTWVERDSCPPRADLAAVAARWGAREHVGAVEVVLDVGALTGLLATPAPVTAPPPPSAAATELVRRVSTALATEVERGRRARLTAEVLAPRAVRLDAGGEPLRVPGRHHDWLARRGRALARDLAAGGYRVHGPTGLLEDPPAHGVPAPQDDAVLRLALLVLGDPDRPDPSEVSA
ncbi:hypothetical protein GCM10009737_02470 [Nocardioides lentus]|uniref:Uncharacterized protein n=1 Tax=Nocardioides lentus TaxID=338077 RepID=A0ABN2NW63_9ACTN